MPPFVSPPAGDCSHRYEGAEPQPWVDVPGVAAGSRCGVHPNGERGMEAVVMALISAGLPLVTLSWRGV